MNTDKGQQVFFELLRAGLWGKEARLLQYHDIDFSAIMKKAEEQSVVGLITAGLEHIKDVIVPKEVTLQFIGSTLQIEQRNKVMNEFVAQLISMLRKQGVYTLLVKGQGIAQCYERPLWRSSGDVDLFLSHENYVKAKEVLMPQATNAEKEDGAKLHLAMVIKGWEIELHGTLHGHINSINCVIDEVQYDVFCGGSVRSWMNGNTQVFLPGSDEDVFFVFTHILQHFYVEGIGLRQICDWCRLLWSFRDSINYRLLESRLKKARIMDEWKAFAAFAVDYLGIPEETMPFYSDSWWWHRAACKIKRFVLETGNFGHNRDMSYKKKYPFVIRYTKSFWMYTRIALERFTISPRNAVLSWWAILKMGANAAARAI